MSIPSAKFLGIALASLSLAAGACTPVANYPDLGDRIVSNDPNVTPMPTIVAAALRHAIMLYPVAGDFIINPPQGQTRRLAEWIRNRLDNDHAFIVEPATIGFPVYHVAGVTIRGGHADVELLCPTWTAGESYDTPPYEREYRHVLIQLEGRLNDWKVTATRSWPPRLIEPPQLYGWK